MMKLTMTVVGMKPNEFLNRKITDQTVSITRRGVHA